MKGKIVLVAFGVLMLGWLMVSFYSGRYETRTVQAGTGAKMEVVVQMDPFGKLGEKVGMSLEIIKILRIGVTVPDRDTVWFETEYPGFTFNREKPELFDDGQGALYTDVGVGCESTAISAKYDAKGILLHVNDVSGNELSLFKSWPAKGGL